MISYREEIVAKFLEIILSPFSQKTETDTGSVVFSENVDQNLKSNEKAINVH